MFGYLEARADFCQCVCGFNAHIEIVVLILHPKSLQISCQLRAKAWNTVEGGPRFSLCPNAERGVEDRLYVCRPT